MFDKIKLNFREKRKITQSREIPMDEILVELARIRKESQTTTKKEWRVPKI